MTATLNSRTDAADVTGADVLARVRELLPDVAARAVDGERDQALPAASGRAFLDAGLARILTPRRFGGHELGLDVWFDAVAAIGAVDAAHAWCASLIIHHPHYLAQFPLEAQEAVWADGPDVAITTSLNPVTKVEAVDGGYRLTGEAAWSSGVGHSTWAMIGGMLPVEGPPRPALFLVPASEYSVRQTWDTVGMRGTGSNTIVTDGAFVPATHHAAIGDLLDGAGPGGSVHDNPIYHAPMVAYSPLTFVVPMLGAAQGALARFQEFAAPRMERRNTTTSTITTQIRMGRAAADIDAAELLLRRGMAIATEQPSIELRARSMRDWGRAAELIVGAVNDLLALSGTAGFSSDSALQQAWRDVNFAARHVTLNADNNFAHWSRTTLGVPRNPAENTMY